MNIVYYAYLNTFEVFKEALNTIKNNLNEQKNLYKQ